MKEIYFDNSATTKISDVALDAMMPCFREFYGNPASEMKIIGFTGTSGKTSSTHIMKHVLEETLGAKVGLIGTIQNMIGDEIIETVEVDLRTLEVVQCHGKHNHDTEYHERIIDLVNKNANLIRERMKAA